MILISTITHNKFMKLINEQYLTDKYNKNIIYSEDIYISYRWNMFEMMSTHSVEILEYPWVQNTFSIDEITNKIFFILTKHQKLKLIKW